MKRWMHLLLLLSLLGAACTPEAGPRPVLPTVASLPTLVPTTTSPAVQVIPEQGPTSTTAAPAASPTATSTISETPTVTVTPSATITDTPTATATNLPTVEPEARPLLGLIQEAVQATILPPGLLPPPNTGTNPGTAPLPIPTAIQAPPVNVSCTVYPAGGFGSIFFSNPDLSQQLGCPTGNPPEVVNRSGAYQSFERGIMIWIEGDIFVLYTGGRFEYYEDTFDAANDPETVGATPPQNLFVPIRGFGKVWANAAGVRDSLGWATQPELGAQATLQAFTGGWMVWLSGRNDVIILIDPGGITASGQPLRGQWRSIAGQF